MRACSAHQLAAVALLLVMAGCGYGLSGVNRFLPEHVKTIAVPSFDNLTSRAEIDQRITEQVLVEFSRRGDYSTQPGLDGADAVLEGAVTAYSTRPVEFSARGRATRVEVVVRARVLLTDLTERRVLWSQDHFIFRSQYDVPGEDEDFFDKEILAIEEIASDFARTVVTSILEGF